MALTPASVEDNPFATMTPEQALAGVNEAIRAIEVKGQEYEIADRRLKRGDLRWLLPERARLEKIVNSRRRGGPTFRRVVPL
jgi:hypothetical protein